MDLDTITQILNNYKHLQFVDRIVNKNNYPTLDLGNGQYATHKMSFVKAGDKYHVFPTVLYENNELKQYPPMDAYMKSRKNKEYIELDNEYDALEFSQQYKQYWGQQ